MISNKKIDKKTLNSIIKIIAVEHLPYSPV